MNVVVNYNKIHQAEDVLKFGSNLGQSKNIASKVMLVYNLFYNARSLLQAP